MKKSFLLMSKTLFDKQTQHMRTLTTLVALSCSFGLHAQETVPASGGDATGAGGSSSYTVGQVVYTTATGTNGSLAQGVQQPYEISITTGVKETTINLKMNVYPNPTTNYLTLKVDDFETLNFQLIDLHGKTIENKKVTASNTSIKMEALPKAIYFLNVTKGNQIIKTFKVIKN
jgi:hypothetical protein